MYLGECVVGGGLVGGKVQLSGEWESEVCLVVERVLRSGGD